MSSVRPSQAIRARSSTTAAPARSGMYAPHPQAQAGAATFDISPAHSSTRTTQTGR